MNLDTQSLQPIINFIWTVADDVLINKYLENQYQDVILPMTVLRRLDLESSPYVLQISFEYPNFFCKIHGILRNECKADNLSSKKMFVRVFYVCGSWTCLWSYEARYV